MEKLKIENDKDFRITKLLPWGMHFRYRNEEYFVHEHENDFGDGFTSLYYKKYENNKYKLEFITCKDGGFDINRKHQGETYHQMKNRVLWNLTFRDFLETKFTPKIQEIKKIIENKRKIIDEKYEEIENIRKEIKKLNDEIRDFSIFKG